jgi:mono/diheme cytochrome c family protein
LAPRAPLTAQEQRGERIYKANCAVCHNAYKKEALNGPPLVGLYKKDSMPSGTPSTDPRVRDVIIYGKRMMPPFNMALDDSQVTDLIAYLHTL